MRQLLVWNLLILALIFAGLPSHAQDAEAFTIRLTPMPLDVEIRTRVTGSGSASAVLRNERLTISGSFSGLRGAATFARVHQGMALGMRGPAIARLEIDIDEAATGRFSGDWRLEREQLEALRGGRLYVQIHSDIAPDGNLWGWLLPAHDE